MKTGKSFKSMGLSPEVLKAIDKLGFRHPTPVQRQAVPPILTGIDVVSLARTGSGKTAAFAIPTVHRLGKHSEIVGVRAIVLSPTRELAMQTCKVFQLLARFTDLRIALIVGGHSMDGQFDRLMNNPDIIIATPGRLVHHLDQGGGFNLGKVEMLILDEGDRLFELGFSEQIQSIVTSCPRNRQVLVFSATLPSQLVQFAKIGLNNPEFVRLDSECSLSDNLEIQMAFSRNESKPAALMALLRSLRMNPSDPNSIGKTIVFVATRHHVDFIGQLISKCSMGSVTTIYGSMEQQVRTSSLARFRDGFSKILVVTDVAARGLDIPDVDCVIHYDFPCSPKLFIHRTGRTARNGKSGRCIGLVTLSDMPYLWDLVIFLGADLLPCGGSGKRMMSNDGVEVLEGGGSSTFIEIGGIANVDDDNEMVDRWINQDTDLESAKKSMEFAMQPYFKTRPAASKQAVKQSRLFLQNECGGQQALLGNFLFNTMMKNISPDEDCNALMNHLRKFRPGAWGGGCSVVDTETRKSLEGTLFSGKRAVEIAQSILKSDKETEAAAMMDIGEVGEENEEEKVVDAAAAVKRKRKFKSVLFFHDIDKTTNDARGGVNDDKFDEFQLDLVPETAEEISKAHIAKKWDKKKMRYVGVRIGADGNAVTKRNESGARIIGSSKKDGRNLYQDWSKRTRKQIQKVGEVEVITSKVASAGSLGGCRERGNGRRAAGHHTDEERRTVTSKTYNGEIPWQYLTNKQKRLEKRQKNGNKNGQQGRDVALKPISSISKERRLKQTRKILQDKHKRKEFHKLSKESYLAKKRNEQNRGASSRSWKKKTR